MTRIGPEFQLAYRNCSEFLKNEALGNIESVNIFDARTELKELMDVLRNRVWETCIPRHQQTVVDPIICKVY